MKIELSSPYFDFFFYGIFSTAIEKTVLFVIGIDEKRLKMGKLENRELKKELLIKVCFATTLP